MILHFLGLCIVLRIASAKDLSSDKRGLIYIQSEDQDDDTIWNSGRSDLTWYYNYGSYPTDGLDNNKFQFVPMLWGKPDGDAQPFNKLVEDLIDGGTNVKYVLGFNEPDLCDNDGYGGSCIDAKEAAQIWIDEIEPLRNQGIKLGAPAVRSAPEGNEWLAEFFSHCDGKCEPDFLPLHWYGPFDYLPDYIEGMHATYENMSTVWLTEFAYPDGSLEDTQSFYNESTAYLDESTFITRYAYFGSFRSSAANDYVGENVAMLNRGGALTDIGAWYLGRQATGNLPSSSNSNDAVTAKTFTGSLALVLAVAFLVAL